MDGDRERAKGCEIAGVVCSDEAQGPCVEDRGVSSDESEFTRSGLHSNVMKYDGKYIRTKTESGHVWVHCIVGVIGCESMDRLDCKRLYRCLQSSHAGSSLRKLQRLWKMEILYL